MQSVAVAFIVVMASGRVLLILEQLAYPAFGFMGKTVQETKNSLADVTGLINIPSATLSSCDTCVLVVCGIILTVGFSTCIWANNGLCMWLLFPVLGPMFARYYEKKSPTKEATAQSIGSQGVSASMFVAQVFIASMYKWCGLLVAWISVGTSCHDRLHSMGRWCQVWTWLLQGVS